MFDFNWFVEKYLHREFKPKQIGRYYPSEIGNCIRKVWFSYKYPIQIKSDLIKIFEMGNILHNFVVNVLKSEKNPEVELLESEMPFKIDMGDFLISGRIDNLLLLKENSKKILVEVKSTSSIKSITEPMSHNVMQLQLYMHALNIHDGTLLYVEKNTLKSKVFYVEFKQEIANHALERFRLLHKFLNDDIAPIAEAKNNGKKWECNYCDYREMCEDHP